jgi:methylmalonyl-CoA/ethylmalonyl-CoA epimerase
MIIRKIDHIHLVVGDMDRTLKAFEKILGLTPWSLGIKDFPALRQTMLTPQDGARIELLEPKDDRDFMYNILQKKGDGVYGISVVIDNFDEEVKKLKEKGVRLEIETFPLLFPGYTLRIAWVSPEEGQGVWIELVDSASLPPSEKDWETKD